MFEWSPVIRFLLHIWNLAETSLSIAIYARADPRVRGVVAALAHDKIMALVPGAKDFAAICLWRLVDDEDDVASRGQEGYAVVGDALFGRDVVPLLLAREFGDIG